MIGRIAGTLIEQKDSFAVVDVSGVGYRLRISANTLMRLPKKGEAVILLTHLAVREDSLDLYGFIEPEERTMFELLLTVSGIGPKTAIAVLSIADVETLRSAVAENQSAYLTKVAGVGKKLADKIVLELRDKVGAIEKEAGGPFGKDDADVLEALRSLGYQVKEAREALKEIPKETTGASERLKVALKILGK